MRVALTLAATAILAPTISGSAHAPSANSAHADAATQLGATVEFDRASDEIATLSPTTRRVHPAASSAGTSARGTAANTSTSAPTTGGTKQLVYASVVTATSKTSDDVNSGMTESAIKSVIAKMNTYWSTQSGGKVSFAFGGYETRSLGDASCNANNVLSEEEASAFNGRFADQAWAGTGTHLLVLTKESCGAQSFATVSTDGGEIFSGNGIGSKMGTPYLLHEFGHNLGFEHADGSICESTSNYDRTISDFSFTSSVCPTTEYDDYLDIMGYTVHGATPNVSSVQRILSGWMTNYTTLTSDQGTTKVTLKPLGSSGGTQAVVVTDPISGEDYYLEYRAPVGLDKTSAEFNYQAQCGSSHNSYEICNLGSSTKYGVVRVLRALPVNGNTGTTVLALTKKSGSSEHRLTHLGSGAKFVNYDDGFSFTINSLSISKGASITVSF